LVYVVKNDLMRKKILDQWMAEKIPPGKPLHSNTVYLPP